MSEAVSLYKFTATSVQKCEVMIGTITDLELLLPNGRQYIVIVDEGVMEYWGATISSIFDDRLQCLDIISVPQGEACKQVNELLRLVEIMQRLPLNRRDVLIAIGGGACCDVGGFAAACYMRGIAHVLIPTTLLAMIDAAQGGKFAVNLTESKNLFGGFHTPEIVWLDLDFLKTLSIREMRQALAEVVKIALITNNSEFFAYLESFSKLGPRVFEDRQYLTRIIEFSVIEKLKLVEPDWKERDLDRLLNLGHAVAHSLEKAFEFDHSILGHGEAVALGLAACVRFSQVKGFMNQEDASRIIKLLDALDLPISIQLSEAESKKAASALEIQKRIRGGNLRLVLPKSSYSSFIYHGEDAIEILHYLEDNSR